MILSSSSSLLPLPHTPLSFSHSCFVASPLDGHADASSAPYVASVQRFYNADSRFCDRALPDRSAARRLRFAAAFLASSSPMTASFRYFSDMAHSSKRFCKALELNRRSKVLDSDGHFTFDPKFRVSAFDGRDPWQSPAVQQERPGDDGVQSTLRRSDENKKNRRNLKSAEELHNEAIEGYLLRYENREAGCFGGDGDTIDCEANIPQLKDTLGHRSFQKAALDGEDVNRSINESNYLDASIDSSVTDEGGPFYSSPVGLKDHNHLQNGLSRKMEEIRLPSKVFESVAVNAIDGSEDTYAHNGSNQTLNTLQGRDSDQNLIRKTDDFVCSDNLDENKILETEKHQSQDKEFKSKTGNAHLDDANDLNEDQKIRMELNRAAAVARRNMRCCEDAVTESRAKGLPFPKFESLLVEKSWAEALKSEFQKLYMDRLHQFVSQEAAGRIPIYPPPSKLFNAFNSCPLDKVKVVILGQDPYHGPGQAMGLCFSVEKGSKLPSSLNNIFLEIQSDFNCDFPTHGNLEKWAHQGVLLLNTVLTVRDRHPNSHSRKGWEVFTDAAIRTLVQQRSGVVFLLWGNQAQEKLRLINKTSHHILKAYHPSGISAHRGFFRCRHFSKTNELLIDEGLLPIDWQL